jgi:quinol monooxygenase YgiN
MQNDIYSMYHLSIDPSSFGEFEALVQELVAATAKEPGTTIYEYVANADRTAVHIIERYHAEGLLPHVEHTFAPYAEKFLSLAKIEKLFVYGNTTTEIRKKLDGFGAEYLTPVAGFAR